MLYQSRIIKSLVALFMILCLSPVLAQSPKLISSDRPGQANTPYLVGHRILQWQGGVDFYKRKTPDTGEKQVLKSIVVRYGLSNRFEVSPILSLSSLNRIPTDYYSSTISETSIAVRAHLCQAQALVPQSALFIKSQLDLNKTASFKEFSLLLINAWTLSQNWALNLNNTLLTPTQGSIYHRYVINVSYQLHRRLALFTEVYGTSSKIAPNLNLDAGLAYLLNPNLQIDLYYGGNKQWQMTERFISAGLSYRHGINFKTVPGSF